jgi:hypothetical protein
MLAFGAWARGRDPGKAAVEETHPVQMGGNIAIGVDQSFVAAKLDHLADDGDILPDIRVQVSASDSGTGNLLIHGDQDGLRVFVLICVNWTAVLDGRSWWEVESRAVTKSKLMLLLELEWVRGSCPRRDFGGETRLVRQDS